MGESKTKTGSITGDSKLKMGVNAGGRTCLPKFKFSAKFPIGLHVILHLVQIKKIQICLTSYHENYFKRKAVGVEHRTPLEISRGVFINKDGIPLRCITVAYEARKWVLPNLIELFLPPWVNAAYHPRHQFLVSVPSPGWSLLMTTYWGAGTHEISYCRPNVTALNTHDCKPLCNSCRAMVN